MDKKMSREQAEKLADELLAQQPQPCYSRLVQALLVLSRLCESRPIQPDDDALSGFISPASPLWGVMHRDTDTSK